jgi:hypothetical protein
LIKNWKSLAGAYAPRGAGERRLMLLMAFLFVLAIVLSHLFSPSQVTYLADSIVHSLHAPGFAAAALVILLYLQWKHRTPLNYLLAGGTAMAIGVLSEIAQIPGPRDAQFSDLIVDAIGVFGALGTAALWDEQLRSMLGNSLLAMLAILSVCALGFALWPTIWQSYAIISRADSMPTLLTFEKRWERNIYALRDLEAQKVVPAPEDWPAEGDKVLHSVERGRFGILLRLYPHPHWKGYSQLSFIAASGNDTIQDVTVAIRDIRPQRGAPWNRFYSNLDIGPEPRRYTVDLREAAESGAERPFDMQHIEAVVVSASHPGSNVELFLDDFRLE